MRDPLSGRTEPTELEGLLRAAGVERLVVAGLATDYCVEATVLDARALGFEVTVLTSAIRAVDLAEGDGDASPGAHARGRCPPGARRARRRGRSRRARAARLARMTTQDDRPYSPGLQGVVAGETELSLVDGANGRLLYRGYPIGELVAKGTYPKVAELLWTGTWPAEAHLACEPLDARVLSGLVDLPNDAHPMDALRTAVSAWGAGHRIDWPPTVEQARTIVALAPSALAAFGRLRQGLEPIRPKPQLDLAAGFLYQLTASSRTRPRPARWTPTSSWPPSTASTPPPSRPASSPRPARTWPAPSPVPSVP